VTKRCSRCMRESVCAAFVGCMYCTKHVTATAASRLVSREQNETTAFPRAPRSRGMSCLDVWTSCTLRRCARTFGRALPSSPDWGRCSSTPAPFVTCRSWDAGFVWLVLNSSCQTRPSWLRPSGVHAAVRLDSVPVLLREVDSVDPSLR
jgi:hypothetical protein